MKLSKVVIVLSLFFCSSCFGWFGGVEPIGPREEHRRLFAPYDLVKLNCLATNYCENLLDKRVNVCSYTHLNYDIPSWDAWHLQYPDDTARFLEGLVFEDRYSPVVRLELARRITKGLMSCRIPATKAAYNFKYRSDGKTFLMFSDKIIDDPAIGNQGRLLMSMWIDWVVGSTSVGFKTKMGDNWYDVKEYSYTEKPENAGDPRVARSAHSSSGVANVGSRYWNESPYTIERDYKLGGQSVNFVGKYWLSNEDKPLEFGFTSKHADVLDIVVGEPKNLSSLQGMANGVLLGNGPGTLHLPDRTTTFYSEQAGDKIFEKPDFNYLILRKEMAFAASGYSTALLVMWDGKPDQVQVMAENGYGEIIVSYSNKNGKASGKVWLYPFYFFNPKDMGFIFSNAECFLETGSLMQNGFPSNQFVDNVPAGLAAGAYLLTKYNDPTAKTARLQAEEAVDAILLPEKENMKMMRIFSGVKAAVWMTKIGKLLKDDRLVEKYSPWIDYTMGRMITPEVGYDGKAAWGDGWTHFYATRAAWMAYDETGKKEYLDIYERAMSVYTIDEKGMYRYGQIMAAPGGGDTYGGSLPLGAWGHSGKMDYVNTYINLEAPNGWHNPTIPMKDVWNDTGSGPWPCDDANPNFVGYCLGGIKMPINKKCILPLGSFAIYDANGNLEIENQPMIDNPYFPRNSTEKVVILTDINKKIERSVSEISFKVGDEIEKQYIFKDSGTVADGRRVFGKNDDSLIYKFDITGSIGAAIDMNMCGNGYTIEVSPDGKRWFEKLNSWSVNPVLHSLDISFMAGNPDELLKIFIIDPSDDKSVITTNKKSKLKRENYRYVDNKGFFVYKLSLANVVECHLELIVGNGYCVAFSADGKNWNEELNYKQIKVRDNAKLVDAGWLRIVDITKYLNRSGYVYMKFENTTDNLYQGQSAFLRKVIAYGIFDSDDVYVKFSNAKYGDKKGFNLNNFALRSWSK